MIFGFICKFMDAFHITVIQKSIIHWLIHSTLLTKYVQSESTKFLQEDFWIYIQGRTVPNHNASDRRSSIDFPQFCQTEGREKLEWNWNEMSNFLGIQAYIKRQPSPNLINESTPQIWSVASRDFRKRCGGGANATAATIPLICFHLAQ